MITTLSLFALALGWKIGLSILIAIVGLGLNAFLALYAESDPEIYSPGLGALALIAAGIVIVAICFASCNQPTGHAIAHPGSIHRANEEARKITSKKNEQRINQGLSELTHERDRPDARAQADAVSRNISAWRADKITYAQSQYLLNLESRWERGEITQQVYEREERKLIK